MSEKISLDSSVTETMLFLQFNHNFCFIASVDIVCFLRYSTKYMIILT